MDNLSFRLFLFDSALSLGPKPQVLNAVSIAVFIPLPLEFEERGGLKEGRGALKGFWASSGHPNGKEHGNQPETPNYIA